MNSGQRTYIRENFEFFQAMVGSFLAEHEGQYALIRDKAVVEFFTKPIDALEVGYQEFADGRFSVQRVNNRPFDLGFLSYGAGDGSAY